MLLRYLFCFFRGDFFVVACFVLGFDFCFFLFCFCGVLIFSLFFLLFFVCFFRGCFLLLWIGRPRDKLPSYFYISFIF